MKELIEKLKSDWLLTLRRDPSPEECTDPTVIPLPRPFTSPTIDDYFSAMYYWDTYFTNVGLILSDMTDAARDNVENIAYLIEKLGYMPNANRTYYDGNSQPPFFTAMVRDVYQKTQDRAWLLRMYRAAEREYNFWQSERKMSCGLNAYGSPYNENNKKGIEDTAAYMCDRLSLPMPETEQGIYDFARTIHIFCESGWDCTSRMGLRPFEYAHVDLNAILYGFEKNMEYFSRTLSLGDESLWHERSEARAGLMRRYCVSRRGFFTDCSTEGEPTDFFSVAAFYPLFFGLATASEAEQTVRLLPLLEREFGLSASERRDDLLAMQWDDPFGWPPLHFIVIRSLLDYGYRDDALRLAGKYCDTVEREFLITGDVYEKYDVTLGRATMSRENTKIHPMRGWSAGVYLWCRELLSSGSV